MSETKTDANVIELEPNVIKSMDDKEQSLPIEQEKSVLYIFKNVFARVYLNIYGGDFTKDNGLTLKATLMEFFLPTTKRKQSWRHWLGAGSSELSILKAAFIIFLDIVLFFPRLVLNIAKLFTEVLPDTIAQLFLLANKKAKKGYKKTQGLTAFGYGLSFAITGFFAALFKSIYFIGCCITSPIATSIRARRFNYKSFILSGMSAGFSHVIVPMLSFLCYFTIALLLANLIPGLGFVTLPVTIILAAIIAYIVADHLLSCFNRNPNGDKLFEFSIGSDQADEFRYTDLDAPISLLLDPWKLSINITKEIAETLEYKVPSSAARMSVTTVYPNPLNEGTTDKGDKGSNHDPNITNSVNNNLPK